MKNIIITLVISDPETVEAYECTDADLIEADLRDGTLMQKCEVVSVKEGEG